MIVLCLTANIRGYKKMQRQMNLVSDLLCLADGIWTRTKPLPGSAVPGASAELKEEPAWEIPVIVTPLTTPGLQQTHLSGCTSILYMDMEGAG